MTGRALSRAAGVAVIAVATSVGSGEVSGQLALGVTGGVNRATIAWSPSPLGDLVEGLERRSAFTGGVVARLSGPGRLHLRAEIVHEGKGFAEVDGVERTELEADYLQLPVLVGVEVARDRRVGPGLYLGPWIARETGCRASARTPSGRVAFDCDEVPGDPVLRKKTDFGWAVAATLTVRDLGPAEAVVDLRYSAALRNIDAAEELENIDVRHRGYALSLALLVPLR
jgi:hypothetical protein